ncbi:MAG: hypothetical protein ACJ8DZ_06355 [Allosphingosinicella sp.]
MMEADLRGRILDANIGAATVSWDERPKAGGLPAVVLSLIAPGAVYSHDGRAPFAEPRIQATIFARTPDEALALEKALVALLETPASFGATDFGAAFLDLSVPLTPETLDGGVKTFGRAIDLSFTHAPA